MYLRIFTTFLTLLVLTSCAYQHTNITSLEARLAKPDDGVMVAAHRGCWKHAPENSIAAIKNCIALGVDIVEIDVWRTKDNHLVLMHDKTVDRMTNGTGLVSDFSLSELKALTLKNRDGNDQKLTHYTVPTLEEALNAAKGKILVNIDAKQDIYANAIDIAIALNMAKQIIIKMEVAANDPLLQSLHTLNKVNFMPKITQDSQHLSELVDQFTSYMPVAFEVKARTEDYLIEGSDSITAMKSRLWINTLSVSPEKAAGHIDSLAILNPDAHWGRLIDLGVNVIQTDEPEALLRYLRSR